MDPSVLATKPLTELKTIAAQLDMRGYQRLKKADLVDAIVRAANGQQPHLPPATEGGANGSSRPAGPADAVLGPRDGEDGEEVRPRVRTRTRERHSGDGQERDGEDETRADAPTAQRAGADTPAAPRAGAEATQVAPERQDEVGDPDGSGSDTDDRDGEGGRHGDGANRRRRSRRERRRGKGAGHAAGPPQSKGRPDEPGAGEAGEVRAGVLDILPEGYGFLRTSGYLAGDTDVYVSQSQIRRHGLRRGDVVEGPIRQQKSSDKVPGLHHVMKVNGVEPDENGNLPHRPDFKDMTPLFPDERLRLETPDGPISMRIVDLMSPIGKGQRGLVVSPPKAGKTTILKELGQAIAYNNPECHVMVVLVDERPEEVTDMQRSVPGEIVASTFDRPADDHTSIAELAIERAKRLVEAGRDVVILLDSITRLSRAYNLAAPASGRIMSGGVDSTALYPPKRFFGAARNIEGGGSLTIIATALIETGSKMDEVIFEEFKGTGNMELRLDRRLEQKRIFPAIDIEASGTRKEELLLDKEELMIIWKLRRVLHALDGPAALELLIDKMRSTRSNNKFLLQIQQSNLQS
ncbi:MAG TPA: transcription termination factor Rho [Egibacteraceae bacterium]|nr:transcription termination factor Rho [Egibacteraceae bacterium]